MRPFRLVAVAAAAMAISGCASEREMYEGVYYGLQSREQMVKPERQAPSSEPPMSYERYEAERGRLKSR
jgi:hypothetical protein